MTPQDGIDKIQEKFIRINEIHTIPLMNAGRTFTAHWGENGISVSNLDPTPLLSWKVFECALTLLIKNGVGELTIKGNAMQGKLGDNLLPLNSIEGKIAYEVNGKPLGKSVFRKISAISGILVYSGICVHERGGYLILLDFVNK